MELSARLPLARREVAVLVDDDEALGLEDGLVEMVSEDPAEASRRLCEVKREESEGLGNK